MPKPDLPRARATPRTPSTMKERIRKTMGTHKGTMSRYMKVSHRMFSTARSRATSSTAPISVTSRRTRAT